MKKLTFVIISSLAGGAALSLWAGSAPLGAPDSDRSVPAKYANRAATRSNDELIPDEVSQLSAAWDLAANGMKISFTAPTTGSSFDFTDWTEISGPLTEITSIEVSLYNGSTAAPTLLKKFSNPAPGEEISYLDTSLQRGKTYSFVVKVYANDEESDGAMLTDILAGGVPAAATGLSVTSADGSCPFTLTFTAPAFYSDGVTPLESIAKGELWTQGGWFEDPKLITEIGSVAPGEKVEYIINDPALTGEQKWALILYSADGASEKMPFNFYIGIDTPGKVMELSAIEDTEGVINLSWQAPATGSRGGWFNAAELSYDVNLLTPGSWGDDSQTLATNLTDTRFTYTLPGNDQKEVRFAVTAKTGAGYGTETATGYMVVGPALQLPFTESYNSKESEYSFTSDHLWGASTTCTDNYPPKWRIAEYCYDGNAKVSLRDGQGALIYLNTYSSTPESDFALTSSKISVAGQNALDFSYSYFVPQTPAGNTSLSAAVSFDNGGSFTQLHAVRFAEAPETGWQTASAEDIKVPAGASAALIRITGHNSKEAVVIAFDDVRLRASQALPDVYPASVSGFGAELNADASAIDVKLTAPSLTHPSLGDVNNQPLSVISRIVLLRQVGYATDYAVIHEFIDPAPGSSLTFADTDIAEPGEYYYKAIVYVGNNCDYGNYIDAPIMIGQIPAEITDLELTTNRGAAPVTVSFRLPETDYRGEPLKEIAGVAIYRYNTDTFVWDTVAHLSGPQLLPGSVQTFDDADVAIGEIYEYRVVCEGSAGNSYGTNGSVYVGKDTPERPENLVATIDEDGFVNLSWEAPVRGVNNGYIDTDHLTYTIQRGNGYSDYNAELLQAGVTATTFKDPTGFGDEEIVKYFVKAVSGQLAGYSAISNTLLVGDPTELPFSEPFNKVVGEEIQPIHSTWTTESTEAASDWAFAEMAYFMMEGQVKPVDNDGGLAYAFYGPYNTLTREDYLLSGNMDVAGLTQPGLSYYVYGVPGYDSALGVEVSFDDDDFEPLVCHEFDNDFSEPGWKKVELPVDLPEGTRKMRLRFTAKKGAYSCSVALDNILVERQYNGSNVRITPVDRVLVAASAGRIVVTGAGNETVAIADLDGRLLHCRQGDCSVALPSGLYLVTVGTSTAKIRL